MLSNVLDDFYAAGPFEADIDEYDIRRDRFDERFRGIYILGFARNSQIFLLIDEFAEALPKQRMVIYDQDIPLCPHRLRGNMFFLHCFQGSCNIRQSVRNQLFDATRDCAAGQFPDMRGTLVQ
jgi:hypothetical protein